MRFRVGMWKTKGGTRMEGKSKGEDMKVVGGSSLMARGGCIVRVYQGEVRLGIGSRLGLGGDRMHDDEGNADERDVLCRPLLIYFVNVRIPVRL